jgi:hypothetical protein
MQPVRVYKVSCLLLQVEVLGLAGFVYPLSGLLPWQELGRQTSRTEGSYPHQARWRSTVEKRVSGSDRRWRKGGGGSGRENSPTVVERWAAVDLQGRRASRVSGGGGRGGRARRRRLWWEISSAAVRIRGWRRRAACRCRSMFSAKVLSQIS